MDKKYELVVKNKRIEVSEQVYRAYYKQREHEKYLEKKVLANEYSFDGLQEEGVSFEFKVVSSAPSPEEILIKKIQIQAVRDAVKKLNCDERQLIDFYFYKKLTERQIAEKLSISHVAVHKRLKTVIKKMRNILFVG